MTVTMLLQNTLEAPAPVVGSRAADRSASLRP
jgi:hypothetical protein